MIYPIVKFGNPVLEKPAEKVTVFDKELEKLVEDMFESMYEAHGVGLAAPQIGIARRIAVIDVTFKEDPDAKLVLDQSRDHSHRRKAHPKRRMPEHPRLPRKRDAPEQSHGPRPGCSRQGLPENRRRPASPRLPPRDRSLERQALHQPHKRPEARPHETQNPQAPKSRRMVEIE